MIKSNNINRVDLYFEEKWKIFEKWWCADETLGIHYAYYDENTRNFKNAIFNMNNLIAELLSLNKDKPEKILDIGCGVGGTSIYLGKKYSKNKFTGITSSSGQVQIGNRFVKENNLKNVEIVLGDFNKTDFCDNYFDGAFAIESVGYNENIKDFISEIYRILKPGGKLVVLDGFQNDMRINPVLKKIYESFLFGRGYQKQNLPLINIYRKLLENNGFEDIYVKDISRNVVKSQIRGIIIGIPFFFAYILKYIFSLGRYNGSKNFFDFSMGVSVFTPIIALKNISRYYLTTAKKIRDD